jgi:hypothetical protein
MDDTLICIMVSEQRYSVVHRETLRIGRFQATYRIVAISAPRACLSRTKWSHLRHNPSSWRVPPFSLWYVLIRTMKAPIRDFRRSI